MQRVTTLGTVCVLGWFAASSHGATLSIDATTRYQTIDGFGGSIAHEMWSLQHYDADYYTMIVDDLGVSLVRLFLQPDFNPQQGVFNTTSGQAAVLLDICRQLSAAGLQRATTTVFTPPAWMKDNNSEVNGGSLLPDKYGAFEEYYVRYIRAIEDCGLGVYAISPQNEPAWAQSYGSCVYSVKQMHDVVVGLGQRFVDEGLSVRMFTAEDVYTNSWKLYSKATVGNAAAGQYSDICAFHHDAVLPTETAISNYREARALLESYTASLGRPPYSMGLWNSEVHATAIDGSEDDSWGDAMALAQSMVMSLRDARMSGWLMGSVTVPEVGNAGTETIMIGQTPDHRYHVCKQFFRYVRPGAVMVDAVCDDADVMATAFVHSDDQTMTLVLVNPTDVQKTVSLSVEGAGGPVFTHIRTSQSEDCDTVGTVTSSVFLPASSITTLYANGVTTGTITRTTARRVASARPVSRVFDLHGRQMTGTERTSRCTIVEAVDGATVYLGALAGRQQR